MKNFKVKWLLLSIILSVASIPQMRAELYIVGSSGLTGNANWTDYYYQCTSGKKATFYNIASGTHYFKVTDRLDGTNWSTGNCISSATGETLTESGKQSDGDAMYIVLSDVSTVVIEATGSGWNVNVSVTRDDYYIKYPWWGRDNWYWSGALADCYDGVNYFTMGPYNGNNTGFCYGRKPNDGGPDCNAAGGSDSEITTTHTTQGSPSSGTQCYFIYNPSNHTLDIRKPHTVTQPNYIYFDNSDAQWSNNKIYFIIGHSQATPWQNVHLTAAVTNTKLRYALNESSWTDAGYYAMIGTGSGGWSGGSGVSYTSLNDAEVRSAVNWDYYEMSANHHYIVGMTSGASGTPITFTDKGTTTSSLNNTQTIKYSISRNGGGSYSEQNSGVTPAQLSLSSYQFANGTYGSVSSTSQTISVNQSSTYSKSVSAAYTATTTFSYTSKRDGYTFIGWYTTASGSTEISSPYYPKGENTIYARFKAHRYTIEYNANDAQYEGTATGSTASNTNVVYDKNQTLTSNGFSRTGYTFAGWNSKADGSGISYTNGQSVSNLSSSDGATVTLYARWTPITYSITYKDKGNESFSGSHVDSPSSHPTSHTYATATSLNSATRAGYTFDGWFTNENCTGTAVTSLGATAYTADITLYAKWTPVTLTFKSDASTSAWGTATNWNPACVPTIEHDVVLKKSAVVSGGTTAAAKSVKIDGSSSTVKLTIESTGALIVAEDIKAKHEEEESYGATNENDLRIESNSSGNGTLIVGNASTNTMASYQAYSKSWYVSGGYGYINQYIGIPFDEIYAYQYYGRILYEYDDVHDAWKASSTTMEAFKAYNILSKTNSYDYFYLDGKLNLPGKDGAGRLQTLTCGSRTGNGVNENGDYMFANSWTAPIYITAMDEDDFVNVAQTIYIFNAGSNKGGTGAPGALGDNPGQWTTITLADPVVNVIPSTQAFLVKNTASGGTLTLDYNKHVFAPAKAAVDAGEDISTEPIRAPKHVQTNDNPSTRLNIIVRGNDIYSDYVRIHKRADFTNIFDDGWEGAKIFGIAAAPQLYAISDIGRMAVNAVPEIEGMVIGFTKGSADDTYTMSFEYDGEEALYLNDLKEQTSTLIAADNSYQFTSAANDTEARFVISRTPIAHTPTGVSDINNQQSAARKLMIDGKLYIIRDGGIYDATGTMVK